MSAVTRSGTPSRSMTTVVTLVPDGFVSSRTAWALISNSTLSCSSAGLTPRTSASDLACTTQGKPSQLPQRIQAL